LSSILLARDAECVFWLARFVERAENLARILEVNETHARDRRGSQNWRSILELNGDELRFSQAHQATTAEAVLRFYLTDAQNPTSIVSALANARENARGLRPLISTEMWVQLNVFYNWARAIDAGTLTPGNVSRVLAQVKEACQTFTGITEGTFYRDQAWYFYLLGRYVERADQTTRLLDAKYDLLTRNNDVAAPVEVGQWHALLRSASGYHAFRRVHSSDLTPARVAVFLLFDRAFPRSVYLCLREVESALTELKSRFSLRAGNDVAEGLDQLRTILVARPIEEILASGLHEFIDFLQRYLIVVTIRLSAAFFGHAVEDATEAADPTPPVPTSRQVQA
jgi:uncharacterized alpha-E superfamily protein